MLLFALALALAAPDGESADDVARARFDAGRVAYDLGHFDEAIADFEAAYAARPLPGFLFNLGQCHLQKGDGARAVWFYERYLETGARDADERAFVRELIAEARALPPRAVTASTTRTGTTAARAAQMADAPPPRRDRFDDDEVFDDGAAGQPPWLWIGVGTGAAVAAAATAAVVGAVVLAAPPDAGAAPSLGVLDRRRP